MAINATEEDTSRVAEQDWLLASKTPPPYQINDESSTRPSEQKSWKKACRGLYETLRGRHMPPRDYFMLNPIEKWKKYGRCILYSCYYC